MSAALRHAARRIGGRALQRPPAEVQRRLFSAGRSSDAKGLAVDGEKDLVGKVKKMKEEMYSVLYECQEKKIFHGTARQNAELLEDLSGQVEPRTNDFRWRTHRIGKMLSDSIMLAGVFSVNYVVLDKLIGPYPKERGKIEPSLEA
ncbi:uncharacterized protein LOC124706911 [Lolium rigidum]|uniref:uncharacterized protein LOC124706911 n=1 Tax=Lolium rigidum TaxID=89674 RepID=UPI001F5CA23E|nr:uncharacterized protein LOC124706911 [Lolium rigidum]XP_047094543.1 uncharacterized protein LOC124706911 [Lolium rigidum]